MEEDIKGEEIVDLPPGFRFHPTDEEIITYYLTEKVMNNGFSPAAIAEADFNKSEPWDLPQKAKMGENEWYFFCQKDRKYPTGMRTNRATETGYWKATGKDKEIYRGKGCLVGMKKTLVFYIGRAPKGEKTNWVMNEFRLQTSSSYHNQPKDEWVVCRVHHKTTGTTTQNPIIIPDLPRRMDSYDEINNLLGYSSVPPLMDHPSQSGRPGSSNQNQFPMENYTNPNFYHAVPHLFGGIGNNEGSHKVEPESPSQPWKNNMGSSKSYEDLEDLMNLWDN